MSPRRRLIRVQNLSEMLAEKVRINILTGSSFVLFFIRRLWHFHRGSLHILCLEQRQRIDSRLEGPLNGPARPLRVEDGANHFDGRPPFIDAAFRIAVFLNGRQ